MAIAGLNYVAAFIDRATQTHLLAEKAKKGSALLPVSPSSRPPVPASPPLPIFPIDRDMFDKLDVTVDVRHIFGELLEIDRRMSRPQNCNN